jgi:SAM-dependent methyltransferase
MRGLLAAHFRTPAGRTPKLLDVGCGRAEFLQSVVNSNWELHGCDWLEALPDPTGINYTRVDLNRHGLSVYGDGTFDAVLCSDVIEHMESPAMLLREIARVLSAQGIAIVSFPNSWNLLERVRFLLSANFRRFKSERVSGPWGHISFFTPDILESLCDRGGLELVRLTGGHGSGHMGFGGYFVPVPASLLLTYNVYAVLRKKQTATARAIPTTSDVAELSDA